MTIAVVELREAKMQKNNAAKCCIGCIYYRALSPTRGGSQKACHHILDTGKKNGKSEDGMTCTTREAIKRAKKRIPAATGKNRPGE